MISRRIMLINSFGLLASGILPPKLHAQEAAGNNQLRLVAEKSRTRLLEDEGAITDVWAYNGSVPGPVIRAKKGEEIEIEFVNQLDQATSIHWHGIRLDNAMDGVSNLTQAPVEPGESFVYRFTPPDAGTFWYHPHNRTWEQLARGLYGTLIVEGDTKPDTIDRDYPVVVDDWRLEENGRFHEASLASMRDWSHAGRMGNILTLNGKPLENLLVRPGERTRLRFINTANARIMRLAVKNHENWLIGLDGQAVTPTLLGERGILLAPAQRADVLVRVNGKSGEKIPLVETSLEDDLLAGYLVCGEPLEKKQPDSDMPVGLVANNLPEPKLNQVRELELVMTGGAMRFLSSGKFKGETLNGRELAMKHSQFWAFNGVSGMQEEPWFKAKKGETVRIKIVNDTLWPHAIHIHGHHFRTLARGSIQTGSDTAMKSHEKNSWRDTILLEREETAEIAFVADNPGKWMLHCHMLEHQAAGMGTWFEIG